MSNSSSNMTGGASYSTTKLPAKFHVSDQMLNQPEISQRLHSFMELAGNFKFTAEDPEAELRKGDLMDEKQDNDERLAATIRSIKDVTNDIRVAEAPGARGLRTNAADDEAHADVLRNLKDEMSNLLNMQKNLTEIRSNLSRDIEKLTLKLKVQSEETMETMACLRVVFSQLFAKELPLICGNRILGSKELPLRQALLKVEALTKRKDTLSLLELYQLRIPILKQLGDILHKKGADEFFSVATMLMGQVRQFDTRQTLESNVSIIQSLLERFHILPSGDSPIRDSLETLFVVCYKATTAPAESVPWPGQYKKRDNSRWNIPPDSHFNRDLLEEFFARANGIIHDITYQLSEKIVEPTASANAVAAQTGRGAGGGSKADNSSRDELQAQRNKTHELQAQYNKLQEASAAVVSGLKEYHRVFNKPGGEKPPCVLHMDRKGECRTHGMVDCNLLATLAKVLNNRSKYGGKSSDGRGGGLGGGRDSGRSSGNASDKDSTRGGRSGGAGGGSRKALTNGANGTSTEELEHLEEEDSY